jgi:FkbM family methyltransferase
LLWHGYYAPPQRRFYAFERVERFVFFQLMEFYEGKDIVYAEIGAGYAEWCMAALGCIHRGLLDRHPASVVGLAVEADPLHYEWAVWCAEKQSLPITCVHAACCERDGEILFRSKASARIHYGARIAKDHERNLADVYPVRAVRLDTLMQTPAFRHVHIAHLDVQADEARVVRGSDRALDRIDHFLIEVHTVELGAELKGLLGKTHDLLVELPRTSEAVFLPGLKYPVTGLGGGLHLWRRKGL